MNHPRTILCFGEALWDVRRDGRTPGGAPMNVALRLASLGGAVRLATRVGRDEAGDSLLAFPPSPKPLVLCQSTTALPEKM
jgi:fructokinase